MALVMHMLCLTMHTMYTGKLMEEHTNTISILLFQTYVHCNTGLARLIPYLTTAQCAIVYVPSTMVFKQPSSVSPYLQISTHSTTVLFTSQQAPFVHLGEVVNSVCSIYDN